MHDVDGSTCGSGQVAGPPNRLGLDLGGPDPSVGERVGPSVPKGLRDGPLHSHAILGMDAHQHAGRRARGEGPGQRGVVDHQSVRIGHVQLHAAHALTQQPPKHLLRPIVLLGNGRERDVERIVDHRPMTGLGVPLGERLLRGLPSCPGEVDHARRSAARGGHGPGLEVVRGPHAADRKVEVRVDVDPAGDHQRPGGVDDLRPLVR